MESSARRIEIALQAALERATGANAPAGLSAAVRHAVFPAGSRVRPRLCLTVAAACGDPFPTLTDGAAAAIELLHCGSLVHDDLPCFDDAGTRRGQPSVHRAFSEPLAVLAGDTLIVLAFEALARAGAAAPDRMVPLIEVMSRAVSPPHGIIAGQAWESEPRIPAAAYRRAKTGALFEAAAVAGAISAGGDASAFRRVGQLIGEAYQIADDILDVTAESGDIGKPVGRDAQLGRPNAANDLGVRGSRHLLEQLIQSTLDAIPTDCSADALRAWVMDVAAVLLRPARAAHEAESSPASAS